MKNKKISIGIGVVIIMIIAITVGVFVWKYEKNQKEMIQEMQANILLEKTQEAQVDILSEKVVEDPAYYKNEGYKYEIEIPSGFSIKSGSLKDPDSLIKIISKQDNTPLFSIDVDYSKFKDINTWLANYKKELSQIDSYEGVEINPPSVLSTEKTIIDGVEAVKLTIHNMPYTDYLIVFIKNDLIYKIEYNGLLLSDEKNTLKEKGSSEKKLDLEFQLKHRTELDQIANSFKFIDNN